MIASRFTLRVLFAVLRGAVRVTVAIARCVTTLLLWLVAPCACLAVKVLRQN
jgi:hypothetical protein